MTATEKIQQTEADLRRLLRERMDNPATAELPIVLLSNQIQRLYNANSIPAEARKF